MDLPDYQPDSDGFLEVREQCWLCRCSWSECEDITIDLLASLVDELAQEVPVKQLQCQREWQLSETGSSRMRKRHGILVSLSPFPECLARCQASRASCFSAWKRIFRGEVPKKPKAGSKRQLWETDVCTTLQHSDDLPIAEAPSRRVKQFRSSARHRKHANGEGCNESAYKISTSVFNKDKLYYICKSILEEMMVPMPCLDSLGVDNGVAEFSASIILRLEDLPDLHWLLLKEEQIILSVAKKRRVEVANEEPVNTTWDSLPSDLQDNIFQRLEFKDVFRGKTLSTAWKKHIESDAFCKWRGATSSGEGSFTALSYYIKNKAWQCSGYDLHSRMWRSLPTFSCLPAPDAELFKEYSVCGHGSLMCAEVSKLPEKGELVVFNPLTGKKRALPPLLFPRSPVLVHILVNSAAKSYKVVVAGSSTASDEHLSKKVEVFDSNTSKWTEACDLPGPVFGLNEHQAGVCINGVLHFIAFLEGSKGVVAFDVKNGTWLEKMACAIPFSLHSNTLQLVESSGEVYLFSEQERGGSVEHCIDVLESSNHDKRAGACYWRNVVRVKKSGGRGLQVYPEHTCVSFGDGKLCVFNTLTRDGVVYDMQDGKQVEVLQPPPPNQKGDNFFSLNPASFTLQPNFDSDPLPPTVDAI